jgi:Mrp family chromosome partitioning ATPase
MAEILTAKSLVPQLELLKHQIQRLLTGESGKPVTVAITSCEAGEGVTTLASNLAASLANDSEVEVLLVDGNSSDKGIQKYLREKDLTEVSRMPDDTLPADWPVHQATENLGVLSARKQKNPDGIDTFFHGVNGSLDKAKEKYQFVILDCPPIRRMYSSLHLFKKVDGVILVIEAEKVRYEVIEREVNMLKEAGANVLGTVLNKRRFPIPKFIYKRL